MRRMADAPMSVAQPADMQQLQRLPFITSSPQRRCVSLVKPVAGCHTRVLNS